MREIISPQIQADIRTFSSVTAWNKNDQSRLLDLLSAAADEKYRKFHSGLLPGVHNLLGVRMPVLRRIGKEIARGDPQGFLSCCRRTLYEETMLEGIVTGLITGSSEECVVAAERFLDGITNWALCDCFAGGLTQIKKYPDIFFEHAGKWCLSSNWWHVRAGLVVMLSWFCDDSHITSVFERCSSVAARLPEYDGMYTDTYYVRMALAWITAEAWVKCRSAAYKYVTGTSCPFDAWTYNKTIQKIRESFRVSTEDKKLLLLYKKT